MRNNGNVKGLRVFDSNNDPYVNLGKIDFNEIHKIKLMAKVTFNDSPEIIRMGEENGSQKIAIGTTHDSSKAESNQNKSHANQYMSDDAKNLYNGLMIRNFKNQ